MLMRFFLIMFLGLALSFPSHSNEGIYGPIGRKDTLWQIAEKLRPAKGVTTQQLIVALYKKNPHAFTVNNINSLRKGAHLLAPTLDEVNEFNRKTAVQMVHRHNVRWKKGRYVRVDAKPPAELQKRLANPEQTTDLAKTETKKEAEPAVAVSSAPNHTKEKSKISVNTIDLAKLPPNDQIKVLLKELAQIREENTLLKQELQTVKQQNQTKLNADIQAQLDTLKHELAELRTILGQKDNHIKTLQASLKSASEAIKSQHADNMRLYDKLKELSPESIPAQAAASGKPQLELAEVNKGNTRPIAPKETDDSGIPKVWADEVSGTAEAAEPQSMNAAKSSSGSIPLSQILNGEVDGNTALLQPSPTLSAKQANISPIAWAAVFAALLFMFFLWVNSLMMNRAMRRYLED